MFSRKLKIIQVVTGLILIAITICFLPTTPGNELLNELKLQRSKFDNESLSDKYSILIDYDMFILKKRLWIIENETNKIILNSHVSHAKKSGWFYVNSTSNTENSKKSSIGAFKTLGTYESKYGTGEYKVGMQIKGLEKHNNNVTKRSIVFHSSYGLWSEGCFMTFPKTNKEIIDLTKNGTFLYVHKN